MPALKDLGRDRAHDRGQAIAERPLRDDHHVKQRRAGHRVQPDQREAADDKTEIADRPHPFAADAVGEMTERDLPRNRDEADEPECPGREARGKARFDQIFRLMHLHRVPGEQAAEIGERDPPEAAGTHRAPKRPVHRGPAMIDDIGIAVGEGAALCDAVRHHAEIFGASLQQEVERPEQHDDEDAEADAGRAPARGVDQPAEPRQDRDRTDADAREGDAQRQPAAPHKPIRQIERLPGIGEAVDPAAGERAQGQIKLPRLADQAAEQQPDTHRGDAKLDDKPRAALIHQPPDKRGHDRRDEKPERKRARCQTAVPAKLVEHRWEQEREGGARIDPDRHRHEPDRDQHPAIKERRGANALVFRRRRGSRAVVHGAANVRLRSAGYRSSTSSALLAREQQIRRCVLRAASLRIGSR